MYKLIVDSCIFIEKEHPEDEAIELTMIGSLRSHLLMSRWGGLGHGRHIYRKHS